jgi:hypothetical protein
MFAVYKSIKTINSSISQPEIMKAFVFKVVLLFVFNCINAQGQNATNQQKNILGNWEGGIEVAKDKSAAIIWRFEQLKNGKLIGFMGPASQGVATLPMSDLLVKDATLNFSIDSQGSYSGQISNNQITGIWSSKSGRKMTHNMARFSLKKQASSSKTTNDIHVNIKAGNIEQIKSFLEKGNDINKVYSKGYTLLMYAIKKDRTNKITSYLLEQGANPNLGVEGFSPLMLAVAYRNYTVIEKLAQHKADLNYVNNGSESALVFAIKERNEKALQLLLDLGANPKQEIRKNYTAIDLAKEENIREILETLNIRYEGVSDGPYVIDSATGRTAVWVHKGKKHVKKLSSNSPQTIKYKGVKTKLWKSKSVEVEQLEYNGTFKVAAISDIHGQYQTFIKLLKNNGVINKRGKWNFGNGHFVIVGDIFDRGPTVTEVLWFLYDLEKQAEAKGGKLHVLLGNHDVMVLNGNLRAIHPKYKEVASIIEKPFNALFNKGSVLGDWLRTRPVLVKINGMLFTHGGLHPDLVSKNVSLKQIYTEFKQQLVESELSTKRNEIGTYLHKGHGPIYYRGYFQGERATDVQINQLLKHYQLSHIIVGHTTHRQIETRYNGKVIVVDANMKSGAMGEILFWETGKFYRGTILGKNIPLEIKK